MRKLVIKLGYVEYFNTSSSYPCDLFFMVANDEFDQVSAPSQYRQITIGPLDAAHAVFPTPLDGLNYYLSACSASILSDVNALTGNMYELDGSVLFVSNQVALYDKAMKPPIQPHISDAAADAATNAPTNVNALTAILLSAEVNSTNAKQNALAAKYNDLASKFNTLMDHLEAQGLQAA